MVRVDLDELVEYWTLLDDERELIAGGHATRQSLEIYSRLALADAQKRYDDAIGDFPV